MARSVQARSCRSGCVLHGGTLSLMATAPERPRRFIRFAGRRWSVLQASHPVGPGPNRFDDSIESVHVDREGDLVLRIRRAGGDWLCAEVVGEEATGYGTYEWTIRSDLSRS